MLKSLQATCGETIVTTSCSGVTTFRLLSTVYTVVSQILRGWQNVGVQSLFGESVKEDLESFLTKGLEIHFGLI